MRLLLSLFLAATLQAQFRAGAAKTILTPGLQARGPVYMAGFSNNRAATGVHDDLYARCVSFAGGGRQAVVCEADLIGLFLDDTDRVRALVRRKFPKADVVVACTHNHEGPDTMGQWGTSPMKSGIDEAYNTFVVNRVAAAAVQALDRLQPARALLAEVKTPELDSFIDDTRPPIVHDAGLTVLRLVNNKGGTIAVVVNWANHPETLGARNTLITADYPHSLCARLESRLGGTGILWNGAVGGMQSPLGVKVKGASPESFEMADAIGARVADLAAGAIADAAPAAIDRIDCREARIRIPVANPAFLAASQIDLFRGRKKFNDDRTTTAPVGVLRFCAGSEPVLEVALIPGEMYPELSVGGIERYAGADYPAAPLEPAIKTLMRAKYRMLIGLANDEIGYLIPKAEWDGESPWLKGAKERWYGEVNSVGPEAAPMIAAALAGLLR